MLFKHFIIFFLFSHCKSHDPESTNSIVELQCKINALRSRMCLVELEKQKIKHDRHCARMHLFHQSEMTASRRIVGSLRKTIEKQKKYIEQHYRPQSAP